MAVGLFAKVAGAWVEIGAAGAGMDWATVSGGTVVTLPPNPDGSVDEVHTFTADGTLTVTEPGYADVLVVGGGGSDWQGHAGGGHGGRVRDGIHALPAGALAVTVGAGGANTTTTWGGSGAPSTLGSINSGRVGGGQYGAGSGPEGSGTSINGVVSTITGTSVEYAKASQASPRANSGDGGQGATGASGIVIVRVQKSAPTVSGVAASGGTESTYTGDGTNGVLGQNYKVHKFTTSGSLVLSQGGKIDVLVCGGGSAGSDSNTDCPGGGGMVIQHFEYDIAPGTYAVTVGAGQAANVIGFGGESSLGSLILAGGGVSYRGTGAFPVGVAGRAYGGMMGDVNGTTAGGGAAGPAVGATAGPGVSSYISGTLAEYGKGGKNGVTATLPGQGGANRGPGFRGEVIVRYKVA